MTRALLTPHSFDNPLTAIVGAYEAWCRYLQWRRSEFLPTIDEFVRAGFTYRGRADGESRPLVVCFHCDKYVQIFPDMVMVGASSWAIDVVTVQLPEGFGK